MIRFNIPGFFSSDSGGPRWGDCTIIDDGKNWEVIDGYCGVGKDRIIARLKKLGVKSPYLYISHAHYDHYKGIREIIRDKWFTPKRLYMYDPNTLNSNYSGEVRSEIATMKAIRDEAKARGIPVTYLKHGDKVTHGEITFYVYRSQPSGGSCSDAHINDGSLCFWFPELSYWTSGDGPMKIGDMCKSVGAKPMFIKIPHHGNNCPRVQANILWSLGTRYCWDNDFSTKLTDFLQTGREDCLGVGMKYFNCHGDLNFIACNKKVTIYKGSKYWAYPCTFAGKSTLKNSDATIVQKVISGKMGNNDARITNLLDAGYYPAQVQKAVDAALSGKTVAAAAKKEEIETVTYKKDQTKNETPKLRDMKELKIIDVSEHNGTINWEKAAKEIDGAIIRCGYGQNKTSQDDKQFRRNVSECTRLGIPFGIYLYSYATSGPAGAGEADHALRCAKGLELSYPIYFDSEDASTKAAAYNAAIAFGNKIEAAGYWCGLYSGEYFYNANLRGLSRFTKWIAKYGSNDGKAHAKPNVSDVAIWQYTSRGKVSGISGNVDMNICYKDLVKSVTGKDYIQAARDVWAGKYGSGEKRTAALKKAGFDPRIVQHYVNRMAT
jgi:GH25 family lysozyme M1 (1,4-beta-N-acetylmuramidase)